MLEYWLGLARGPLLKLALLAMILGLARHFLLQLWELSWSYRKAGDTFIQWRLVLGRNLMWLLPWRYLRRHERVLYNFTSFLFHIGVILVPLGLAGHVAIWKQELGVSWPVLPSTAADIITIVTILALVGLLAGRAANSASRQLSRSEDWLLPVCCLLPFVSGLLVAHPESSPFAAQQVYLVHLLSAELLLVLVPFSKLAHMVLFWSSQTSTELGWRFVPGAGHQVRVTLGKEGEGI